MLCASALLSIVNSIANTSPPNICATEQGRFDRTTSAATLTSSPMYPRLNECTPGSDIFDTTDSIFATTDRGVTWNLGKRFDLNRHKCNSHRQGSSQGRLQCYSEPPPSSRHTLSRNERKKQDVKSGMRSVRPWLATNPLVPADALKLTLKSPEVQYIQEL